LLQLVVALGLSGFLLSGSLPLGQPSEISEIEITCAEPTGCFLQIGQAIRRAPEGAHLRIGPGVYYEKTLVVEKSLVLEGAGASRTQIRLIDPDAVALAVEGRALSVRIEDLTLQGGPFFFPSERWDLWTGTAVLASGAAPDQPVQLRIERSEILGWSGIALPGNVYLSLRESTVIARNVGILSLGSSIEVRDSRIESAWSAVKRGAGIDASFAATGLRTTRNTACSWPCPLVRPRARRVGFGEPCMGQGIGSPATGKTSALQTTLGRRGSSLPQSERPLV